MTSPDFIFDRGVLPDAMVDGILSAYPPHAQVRTTFSKEARSLWAPMPRTAYPADDMLGYARGMAKLYYGYDLISPAGREMIVHVCEGPGAAMQAHKDQYDFTAVFFLTGNPDDGAIRLYLGAGHLDVHPERGAALLMEGWRIPHEVLPIAAGRRTTALMPFSVKKWGS